MLSLQHYRARNDRFIDKYGPMENILKHREFDTAVDHVAVTQILKAKTKLAPNRIMRLLDHLSIYSFNLYDLKGKDMILADYLSRIVTKMETPLISFLSVVVD